LYDIVAMFFLLVPELMVIVRVNCGSIIYHEFL